MFVDTIHHATGLRLPAWDFSLRLQAYQLLVEFHYRYYQFFANMLIALAFSYITYRATPDAGPWPVRRGARTC